MLRGLELYLYHQIQSIQVVLQVSLNAATNPLQPGPVFAPPGDSASHYYYNFRTLQASSQSQYFSGFLPKQSQQRSPIHWQNHSNHRENQLKVGQPCRSWTYKQAANLDPSEHVPNTIILALLIFQCHTSNPLEKDIWTLNPWGPLSDPTRPRISPAPCSDPPPPARPRRPGRSTWISEAAWNTAAQCHSRVKGDIGIQLKVRNAEVSEDLLHTHAIGPNTWTFCREGDRLDRLKYMIGI